MAVYARSAASSVMPLTRRQVPAIVGPEGGRILSRETRGHRLHDCDHPQAGEPALEVGWADGAVLHTVPQRGRTGRLDRITHGRDRAVADGVGGDLKPGSRSGRHQLAQLGRCGSPHALARTHGHAFRPSVDEDLDRSRPHHASTEPGPQTDCARGFEQLPGQELVDANPQPPSLGKQLICAEVGGESAIDRGADRGDASRKEKALGFEDSLHTPCRRRRRLRIRNQPHRRLQQETVGSAVAVATQAAAGRVFRGVGDARGRQCGGVGDPRVPAAFVDECGPPSGGPIQLEPMGRPLLGQLVDAVAHALLPLARLERAAMSSKAVDDLGDAAGSAEVRAETRQTVIDDVRVRVVEAGKHGGAPEVDHPGPRPAQTHDLGSAGRHHPAGGDREVAVRGEAVAPQRANATTRQDQSRSHWTLK